MKRFQNLSVFCVLLGMLSLSTFAAHRERILINDGWRFMKYAEGSEVDELIYDVRPKDARNSWEEAGPADAKPTEAVFAESEQFVLKPWILPTGNDFIKDPSKHHRRPKGNPGEDFPFVQLDFDDAGWDAVDLPHDWAIQGPFYEGSDPVVGGGMGRLPSPGVAWYRRQLEFTAKDADKHIYLELEGAMSYAMVWLNGKLVGGWPFGYSTFQLDLTPYVKLDAVNQLAIRLDNPANSSRWYPGGGIYRDVWLIKTSEVHVANMGTFVTTPVIEEHQATVNIDVTLLNRGSKDAEITVQTAVVELDSDFQEVEGSKVVFEEKQSFLGQDETKVVTLVGDIKEPKLWNPLPETPNMYLAVTNILQNGKLVDTYRTRFGVRDLKFDANQGLFINGKHVRIQGVNQHHDLGALGAAFNKRAAERQLEILKEMGCNAIRMAHNPPDPTLLDLCDEMGFLVFDESFDVWERKKTGWGFHLIFPDWHEQDMRALVRRDRNHPSVIIWSTGNEVGEQYTDEEGAKVARRLKAIVKEEDPTRPTSASMNWAKPDMPFSSAMDLISLNYQGEGIRQDPIFEGTTRIQTPPMYPAFHEKFPNKVIVSSESACAFSSRGFYTFPVTPDKSKPTRDGMGGDSEKSQVCSYELYAVDFGSSADVVFQKQDENPYVAGEFVWAGFDYLGEPTPYYSSRSSYCGIIDLAGFPKNRYYLYQSRWRPDFPMVHILPHWNWSDRVGEVTPVHVFTSGDEAELFINGKSQGRKSKGDFEYRLRWDDVVYEPGEVKVVAYKQGRKWAENVIETTGEPYAVSLQVDRNVIGTDGVDLAFVTATIVDEQGRMVPNANLPLSFSVTGGEIVATDNGDASCFIPFPSDERPTFNGLCLAIVKADIDLEAEMVITAESKSLIPGSITVRPQQ